MGTTLYSPTQTNWSNTAADWKPPLIPLPEHPPTPPWMPTSGTDIDPPIPEHPTGYNENVQNSLIPSPFKFNLVFSKVVSIPSYTLLIFFSALTFYVVFKHFRPLLKIYLSVLFYVMSQLLLLIVLSISWIAELVKSEEYETVFACQIKQGFQTFSLLLPGYCILLITVVRAIFVTFPLSYYDYIKMRYQFTAFALAVLICGLIVAAPSLGFCTVIVNKTQLFGSNEFISYCSFGDRSKDDCKIFYILVASIGMLLPIIGIIGLYVYIYRVAVVAKSVHRALTQTSSSASKSSNKEESQSKKEQRTIPWSIIAILGVCLATTVPWLWMIVYTVEITEKLAEGDKLAVVFDAFYSVIQVLIGCSPLIYLLTTNSLRREVSRIIRGKSVCCR